MQTGLYEHVTQDELIQALIRVPESTLKAVELLRSHAPAPGNLFPTGLTREAYSEATRELLSYSRTCAELAARAGKVSSIPLPTKASERDDLIGAFAL